MTLTEKLRRLGTGCGIEIRGEDLVVVIVKSRPAGVSVLGRLVINGFRERPAGEWGREYAEFLKTHGAAYLSAFVALPRGELIVREISMPPLGPKELAPAVAYQIDLLHPYGDAEVIHGLAALKPVTEGVNRLPVAVVIARREIVDGYAALFEAAGINIAGFTVAAAAFYAGIRVRWDSPPLPFLLADYRGEMLSVYGESEQRPLASAQFDLGTVDGVRAVRLTGADLRLQPEHPAALLLCGDLPRANGTAEADVRMEEAESEETDAGAATEGEQAVPDAHATSVHDFGELFEPRSPEELLPAPLVQPSDFDLRRDAAAMAVALEAACPAVGWKANLLPLNRRRANSRWMFAPTAVLLAALALLFVGLLVRPVVQDSRYVAAMQKEIGRLSQVVGQVNSARQETADLQGRLAVLRQLELRTERDLRILSELSRIIPTTAWVSDIEINDGGVRITGEAAEAAPLLGVLDQSANLTGAAFATSLTRIDEGERFQIVAKRRATEGEAPVPVLAAASSAPEPPARIEISKPVEVQPGAEPKPATEAAAPQPNAPSAKKETTPARRSRGRPDNGEDR